MDANATVRGWVNEMSALLSPDAVHWCDGSEGERAALTAEAVQRRDTHPSQPGQAAEQLFAPLSSQRRCAREQLTFICIARRRRCRADQQLDGTTGGVREAACLVSRLHEGPDDVRRALRHGPSGSPLAKVGIELTDSIYVVLSMRIMTPHGRRSLSDSSAKATISIAACTAR